MKIDMKELAQKQLQEIVAAGEALKDGSMDFQSIQEVYLRNREICRVIGLQTKIAEVSKKSPSKSVQEFAGVAE